MIQKVQPEIYEFTCDSCGTTAQGENVWQEHGFVPLHLSGGSRYELCHACQGGMVTIVYDPSRRQWCPTFGAQEES